MIEQIKEIVISEELNIACRDRRKVYRRFYLCYLLRKEKLTLKEIAKIFNKHHSTIIHAINSHNHWNKTKDQEYLMNTLDLREMFPIRPILRDVILKVNNMNELLDIKEKIKKHVY